MKKRKKWKRIISIFLSLLMVVSLLPAFTVNAEEPEVTEQTEVLEEGPETDGEVPEEVVVEEPEVFLNPVPEEQMGDVDLPDGLYFGADNFDVQGRPLIEETLSTKWRMDAKNTQALYLVVIENGEITPILSSELPNVTFEDYFSGDPIPRGDSGVSGYYLDQAFGYGDDGMPVYPEGLYNFAFDNTGDILVEYGDYSAMLAVVDPQFGLYSAEGGNQADLLWNYANFDGENNVFYIHQNEAFAFDPDEETSYKFVAKEINFSVMEDSMEGRVPSNVVDNGKVSLTPVGDGSDIKVEILDYESDYQFRVVVSYTEEMYVWDDSIGETGDWNYVESSDNKEYEFPFSKNYGWNPDQPGPEIEDGLYFGEVDWDDKPYASSRNLSSEREFGAKTNNQVSLYLVENGVPTLIHEALDNISIVRRETNADALEIDLGYVSYGNPEDNLEETDVFNIYSAVTGDYKVIYEDASGASYLAYFTIALPNTGIYSADTATIENLIDGHEVQFDGIGQVFYLLTADQQSADGGYIRDVVFSKAPEVRIEGRDAGYWDSICSIEPVGTDKKKYKVTILEDFEEIWIEADAQETEKKKNDEGEYDVEVMDPWYQSYRFYPSESMNGVYVCDHIDWHDGIPEVAGEGNEWSRNRDWDAKIENHFGIKVIIDGEEAEVSTVDDFNKFTLVKAGSASLPAGTELRKMSYRYWDQKKDQEVEEYAEDMLAVYFTEEGIYYLIYNDGTKEVKAKINVKLPDFGIYSEPKRNINTLIGRTDAIVNSENNVFFLIAADTVWGNSKRDCYYEGDPEISLMGRPEDYWDGVCRIGTYPSDDDNLQIYMVTVLDPTREFAVRAREVETYWDYDEQTGTWELRGDRSSWDTDYWFRPSADQGDGLYIGHMDWNNEGIPYVQENENLEKFWEDSVKNTFSFALYLRKDGEDTLITTDQINNITFGRKSDGGAGSISALGYWDNKAQKDVLSEEIFDAVMNEPGLYELAYHDPETNYGYTVNFYASMPEFAVYSTNEASLETLIAPRNVNYRIGENVFYLIATSSEDNEKRNCFIGNPEVIEGSADVSPLAVLEPDEGDETERVLVYTVTILDPTRGVRIRTTAERTNYHWEETESGAEFVVDGEPWTEEREFEFWRRDAQEGLLIGRAVDGEGGTFVWQDNIHKYNKEWTLNPLKSTIAASFAIADEEGNLVPIGYEDIDYLTVTDMEGNVTDDIQIVPSEYFVDYGDNNGEAVIAEDVIGLIANRTGNYYITYSKDGFTDSVLVKAERQDIGLHNFPDDSEGTLVSDRTGKFGCSKTFYIYAFEFENEYGSGITNEITSVRFTNGWVPAEYWKNRVALAEEEEGKCWSVTILGNYRVPFEVEVEYEHTDYWDNNGTLETNERHGGEWFRFEPEEPYDDYVYAIDDGELLQGFTATYIPEIVYQYPELMWSEYMGENVTMYYVHGETMEEVIEKLTAVEIGEKLIGVPVAGEDIDGIREATAEDNIVNTGYIEVYANQYGDRAVVSQNIPAVENLNGIIFHTEDERYALKPNDTYWTVTGKEPANGAGMYYIQDPKYMFDFFNEGYEDMNNQLKREDISNAERDELTNKIAWLEDAMGNLEEVIAGRDYGTLGDGVVGVDGKFYRAELNENSYENENGEWVTDHYFTLADKVVLFELDQEGISAFESYEFELLREDRDEGMNHPMPYRRLRGIDGINLTISTDVKFSGNLGGLTIIYPEDMENVPNVEFFENTYVAGTGTRNEETGEWTEEPEWIDVTDWDSYPDGVLVESDEWWGTYQILTKMEDNSIPVTGIGLDQESLDLLAGKTATLVATVAPEDATDKSVVWSTSNASIATVDEEGLVTAVGCGSANIYAEAENGLFRAVCVVNVTTTSPTPSVAKVNDGIKVTWEAQPGATKYRIYRKTADTNWTSLAIVTGTEYIDQTAELGNEYLYAMRCMTLDGKSFASTFDSTKSATILYIDPVSPKPVLTKVDNGIKITWDEQLGVTKFRIYRKTTGTTNWDTVAITTGTEYVDTTAELGNEYSYAMRCVSADGKSLISAFDSSKATTILYANPVSPKPVLTKVDNGIKVEWEAQVGVTKFRIYRKTTGTTNWDTVAITTGTEYVDTTAELGNEYSYAMRCVSVDGKSLISAFDSSKATTILYANPVSPKPVLTKVDDGVKVEWEAQVGVTKFRIYRRTKGSTNWDTVAITTGTEYVDTIVELGNEYSYAMRCVSADGKSLISAFDSSKATTILYANPVSPKPVLTKLDNGVKIEWEAQAGVEKYRIFRKTANTDWGTVVITGGTEYVDETAELGAEYTYLMRCVSADGKSFITAFDINKSTKILYADPVSPVPVLTKVENGVKITWDEQPGVVKYRIYRQTAGSTAWDTVAITGGSEYVDTTCVAGTKYTYLMRCLSSDGKSFITAFDSRRSATITY